MFWSPWIVLPCLKNNLSYTQPTFVFALQEDYDIVHVCFDAFFVACHFSFFFWKTLIHFTSVFLIWITFGAFLNYLLSLLLFHFFNPLFLTYTNSNIFLDVMLWLVNLCKSLFIWFAIFISITQVISLYRLSSLSIKLKIINKIIIIVIIKIIIKAVINAI